MINRILISFVVLALEMVGSGCVPYRLRNRIPLLVVVPLAPSPAPPMAASPEAGTIAVAPLPPSAAAPPSRPRELYAGAAVAPLIVTGLSDIDASDYINFPGANEGRIRLPLGAANSDGLRTGLRLGYAIGTDGLVPLLGEFGLFPGKVNLFTFALGAEVRVLRSRFVTLGVVPKIGYALGMVSLGSAEVLPGTVPPVITPEGTFFEGEPISATIGGLFAQIGVAATLRITNRFGLRLDAGYQLARLSNFSVEAGSVTLDQNSDSLVLPDTRTPAHLDPQAKSNGPYGLLALMLSI